MWKPRFHRSRALMATVPVALLIGATACGATFGSDMSSSEKSGTATSSAVVRVELNQSGGFAGVDDVYTVDSGVTDQRREQLFTMVDSQQFRALNQDYVAPNGCRDQFFYSLVVTYSDETTKSVDTDDCSDPPQLLTDVNALVKQIGTHRSGK